MRFTPQHGRIDAIAFCARQEFNDFRLIFQAFVSSVRRYPVFQMLLPSGPDSARLARSFIGLSVFCRHNKHRIDRAKS